MERFKLSDIQAQAILDMRLQKLTGLEREKVEAEYNELMKKIEYLESILADEQLLLGVIKYEILEIKTKLRWSSEFELVDGQTEKLLGICKDCNADIYLSGPAAKDYFDEELAKQENIKVEWMDYSGYKEYEQLNSPFEHGVSILDLIFNQGANAKEFMKSFDKSR